MSRVLATFDPYTLSGGGQIAAEAPEEGQKLLIWNKTNYGLLLRFEDGSTDVSHAWTGDYWVLHGDVQTIEWHIFNTLTSNPGPISQVIPIVYGKDEDLPGTFPVSLQYNTNIGNSGGVPMSVNSIANDGNVAGTNVLEAKVSGQSSSTYTLTNDGILLLQTLIAGALHLILQTATTNPQLTIGQANDTALVRSLLRAAGGIVGGVGSDLAIGCDTGHFIDFTEGGNTFAQLSSGGGSTLLDSVNNDDMNMASSFGNINIYVPSGKTIYFKVGGVTIAHIDGTGLHTP